MSDDMPKIAVYISFGVAATYLWGRSYKERVHYFNSISRVSDLKCLEDLVKEKATNLLVLVSGRVGSATPINSEHNGPLSVFLEENAKVDFQIKLEDGGLLKQTMKYLLQEKETPWYLEDSTGRVNVVGAQCANGFYTTLKKYVVDLPASEAFKGLVKPEDFKVLAHGVYGRCLNIGTFLTFVGEAVRDKAGNLMIQKPKGQPFLVFTGEGSFDKMVKDLKSNSEEIILVSKVLCSIAVVAALLFGLGFIRNVLLPFKLEKKDLGDRSKDADSDSQESDSNRWLTSVGAKANLGFKQQTCYF